MPSHLAGYVHPVKGLDAVADAFSTTVYSDVASAKGCHSVTFLLHKGVGATGTSTVTVLAGSDNADPPTASTAIPFRYKPILSSDTEGAYTDATAAGFTTTAGSSQLYLIEVDGEQLAKAGYYFVCLKCVEVVDSPVLGGIIILMNHGGRYSQDIPTSVLS